MTGATLTAPDGGGGSLDSTRKRLTAIGRQFGKTLSVYDISNLYPTMMPRYPLWDARREYDQKRWWKRFTG